MNRIFFYLILMASLAGFPIYSNAQSGESLAFPGADGFGKYATGGRGGRMVEVTNLNDDGAGSFRQAVTAKGSRIVIFKVSGTIHLKKAITISSPNLTIAGQSAPGDGICISGAPVNFKANNMIVRFLRFRLGDLGHSHESCVSAIGYTQILFDHCSFSWGTDYNAIFYNNADFTAQWCIFSESLYKPKKSKNAQGSGVMAGGMKASFHHNLFAHNAKWNPYFDGASHHQSTAEKELVEFQNNVIYNWGENSSYENGGGNFNVINNYYKPGPATTKENKSKVLSISGNGKFFLGGNIIFSGNSISSDNWRGVLDINKLKKEIKSDIRFESGITGKVQPAEDAYIDVMAKAGASFRRDDTDSRIIQSTGTGSAIHGGVFGDKKGIIDSQQTIGGWPVLKSAEPKTDSDGDGIPDDWEKKKGLDPNNGSDAMTRTLDQHYDNIEVYLNDLVKDIIK